MTGLPQVYEALTKREQISGTSVRIPGQTEGVAPHNPGANMERRTYEEAEEEIRQAQWHAALARAHQNAVVVYETSGHTDWAEAHQKAADWHEAIATEPE